MWPSLLSIFRTRVTVSSPSLSSLFWGISVLVSVCLSPSFCLSLLVCMHGSLTGWVAGCTWLAGCLAAWLAGSLSVWLADCLFGWLPNCLTGWLVCYLAVCLSGWLVSWSYGHTELRTDINNLSSFAWTVGQPKVAYSLASGHTDETDARPVHGRSHCSNQNRVNRQQQWTVEEKN